MKSRFTFILSLVALMFFGTLARSQDTRYLLVGTIKLDNGQVAASVKLKLLKSGVETDLTQTDAQGNYGFFEISGVPGDYTIEVTYRGKVVKTISSDDLKSIPRGGRLDFSVQ
jgi:hypothetical protein